MSQHTQIDDIELGGIVSIRDRLLASQAQGKKIMRLESGDPSFDIPPHVSEAIQKALRDGHTHYTAGAGIKELREAAYQKLVRENHLSLKGPGNVLVTNGAMHGLYVVFRALAQEGDEVIVPSPTWTETADNVKLAGATPVYWNLDFNADGTVSLDASKLASLISPKTRAIVLNSPHNPTGLLLNREDLVKILDVACANHLYVVSDEAYEHVVYGDSAHVSAGSLSEFPTDKVISVYSMSKSYAMSGLRLGYVATSDEKLLTRMTKLLRCTINGVNSATQYGAVAALTGPQDAIRRMRDEYTSRRDMLFSGLSSSSIVKPYLPKGAFYIWCELASDGPWTTRELDSPKTGWDFTNWLIDKHGIGSAPGEIFGPAGKGGVRFAFSCPTSHIEEAGAILKTL